MGKIDTYLAFVKEQVGVQQKLAKKYEESPYRKGQHQSSAKSFSELAEFLSEIKDNGTSDTSYLHRSSSPRKRMLLTFEEIDGAPDELLKELNLTDADKQDLLAEHIIAKSGGIQSLDKIMLYLWKKTGEVPKRSTLTSRLYRMVAKGMIFNVPGRKGLYSTYEVTEDEAKRLLGADFEQDDGSASSPNDPEAKPEPVTPSVQIKPSLVGKRFLGGTTIPRRL